MTRPTVPPTLPALAAAFIALLALAGCPDTPGAGGVGTDAPDATATDTDPGSTDTLSYWLWRSGAGVNFPTATGGNETDADPA